MRNNKLFLLLIVVGLLFSCSRKTMDTELSRLDKKKDVELKDVLDSLSRVEFNTFYTKIATKYKDSSQNASFKTSIRILHNSQVNALITFAKIPIFNTLLTTDSIKIVDKRSKCLTRESLHYLKDNFGVEFDYLNVEQLLLGLPVAYEPSSDYFRVNSPFEYTMCSHRKREIRKNERKGVRDIIKYYTLSEDLKSLKSLRIESPDDSTTISIDYKSRELINEMLVPNMVSIEILTPRKKMNVELNYQRTRVNEEESVHFVIPDGYEECE